MRASLTVLDAVIFRNAHDSRQHNYRKFEEQFNRTKFFYGSQDAYDLSQTKVMNDMNYDYEFPPYEGYISCIQQYDKDFSEDACQLRTTEV